MGINIKQINVNQPVNPPPAVSYQGYQPGSQIRAINSLVIINIIDHIRVKCVKIIFLTALFKKLCSLKIAIIF